VSQAPTLELEEKGTASFLELSGDWQSTYWNEMQQQIASLRLKHSNVIVDFSRVYNLDTFGGWVLSHFFKTLKHQHNRIELKNCGKDYQQLLEDLQELKIPAFEKLEPIATTRDAVEQLGKITVEALNRWKNMIAFFGEILIRIYETIKHPKLFRIRSFVKFIEETGLFALPIVGIISFMIGVVLVYQGAYQLERFGAGIFTVNLLGVSILRELGILITAIVVAGRSGSAFTAQIGFMKLNQEIDAMIVLGLNPIDLLVLPRIFALVVTLPFLTLFSDFMALLGGGIMALRLIDLSWDQFLHQLYLAVGPWTFWTGMIKAPIFAFIIAFVGCYEGVRVSGGAEDVGRRTTRSVVRSIFIVMALDALFSVIYSKLGI